MANFLDTVSANLTKITDAAAQSYIVRKLLPTPLGSVPPPNANTSASAAVSAPAAAPKSPISPSSVILIGLALLIGGVILFARR